MPQRFDVLVVGGGAAGCVVARRLADRGARVCIVEAGPDYGPFAAGRWPPEMLDARRLPMTHLWEADDANRSSSCARVLGGCSAHNACMIIRGEPRDYDEWGPGWTYRELEPYLDRAERSIGSRPEIASAAAPWHRAALGAASALGIPGGPFRANSEGGVRWNAAFAYLDPVRDRVAIRSQTLVERVDPPTVVTNRGLLEGATIVLAAGTYRTASILLRSGIGDELPVGENLIDHVGFTLRWTPTRRLIDETAEHEKAHGPLFEAHTVLTPPDLHLVPWTNPDGAGYQGTLTVFLMKPHSRGRVTLASLDPSAPPRIEHRFLSDERDFDPLLRGLELARSLAATEPLASYAGAETEPGATEPERHVRDNVRGYFHPVGTCALGSVCDSNGRVLGYESLAVADASLMPTIPRANTHLSTLAVAEKMADAL